MSDGTDRGTKLPPPATSAGEYGVPDRWFILGLLLLNYFVLYTHRSVFTFIQTPLLEDLQLSESQLHSATTPRVLFR